MLKTHCVTNLRASTQRCACCVLELLISFVFALLMCLWSMTADPNAVTINTNLINVGGEKSSNWDQSCSMFCPDVFSGRWQNQLDAEGHLFVDYSPRVFLPLIEFLRLVRDSEPDMPAPVVVEPEYRRVAGHGYAWSLPCPSIQRSSGRLVWRRKSFVTWDSMQNSSATWQCFRTGGFF